MWKKVFAAVSLAALTCGYASAEDIALAHKKDNARADADGIISMRSALAREFIKPGAEVTEETFKNVCGAVAKKVKEISEKEGVVVRHAAVKNRNPGNAATPEEAALIERFEKDRNLKEIEGEVEIDGKRYYRVTKPIYVENACLACHGDKEGRPLFIVKKYPDDKAYGFKAGDLRGIISVLIPGE